MTDLTLVLVFITLLLFFLASGVWVGLALLSTAVVGIMLFTPRPAGDAMATVVWSTSTGWGLTALPLFIWMGEILFRTRLSENLFRGLSPWLSRLPGGMLHVNVAGCGLFAAVSGSSAATAVTVGKISIPELRKRHYPERMIVGTLAGSGTLGLLIPPSIILIVYGVTVNESITALFMAGILPGIMMALLFMAYIAGYALLRPQTMPQVDPPLPWRQRVIESWQLLPVVGLIVAVLGSIYLGFATATEAAVLGVVGALIISLVQGALSWPSFKESLLGATLTSCMIGLILMGAAVLTLAMGYTGIPRNIANWIGGLGLTPVELIFALTIFYIILGCFLDGISAVVLTMAVVEPLVRMMGFDMIWFGIYLVLVVEMAQITPPIGFNLFVLQGMTRHDMGYISLAAMPMFLLLCLGVVILLMVPEIATFLPRTMQ